MRSALLVRSPATQRSWSSARRRLFHQTHGFHVHGVSIEAAVLPAGWDERTVAACDLQRTRGHTGHCLEAHDLAASKLAARREKDRLFVATLLHEGLVNGEILLERVTGLPSWARVSQTPVEGPRAVDHREVYSGSSMLESSIDSIPVMVPARRLHSRASSFERG